MKNGLEVLAPETVCCSRTWLQPPVPDTGALQLMCECPHFSTRALQAKAVDSLAAFFEACAQMELTDFKDHAKALQVGMTAD